jgi:hypothetical protein
LKLLSNSVDQGTETRIPRAELEVKQEREGKGIEEEGKKVEERGRKRKQGREERKKEEIPYNVFQ